MNSYSFKADAEMVQQIVDYFNGEYTTDLEKYIAYRINGNGANITIYTSGSVVTQGKNAQQYYLLFNNRQIVLPQAGSDEVGTGDYFGPICVCASYIDDGIYAKIADLHIDDSKKLTDEYMLSIEKTLVDNVPHSLLVLDNALYNKVTSCNNMNSIKAKMHNQAYVNLINKGIELPQLKVVDDFCGEDKYYKYIADEENVVKGLTFQVRAESSYVSVAASSIMSRCAFLKTIDKYSKIYNMQFPKGAGEQVDIFAKEFLAKYGEDELKKVAKLNFKNTKKLI